MPSKDTMPKKKPVYSDKRKKKPTTHTPEGNVSVNRTALYNPWFIYVVEYNCYNIPVCSARDLRSCFTHVGGGGAYRHGDGSECVHGGAR